jgi:hypothetical protein
MVVFGLRPEGQVTRRAFLTLTTAAKLLATRSEGR